MIGRGGVAVVVGLGLGFVVGMAWGRSTREQVGGHVKTDVNDGVLTVSVDTKQAATDGLKDIFNSWRISDA